MSQENNWEKNSWCVTIIAEALTFGQVEPIGKDASHITEKLRKKINDVISQTLETERLRIEKEVEKKKLPIPNQYGTAVNLNRFNEVIDEILSIIRPKI